jgi:hypothetical protein
MKNDQKSAPKMTNHNSTKPSSAHLRLAALTALGTKFTVLLNVPPLGSPREAAGCSETFLPTYHNTLRHPPQHNNLFIIFVQSDSRVYRWKPSLRAPVSIMPFTFQTLPSGKMRLPTLRFVTDYTHFRS